MTQLAELDGQNMQQIGKSTVEGILSRLSGDAAADLSTLVSEHKGAPYRDIFTLAFQTMRMHEFGFELEVASEDKDRYQIDIDEIASYGMVGRQQTPEDEKKAMDSYFGPALIRVIIATAFKDEAAKQKAPLSSWHSNRIDIPVITEDLVEKAHAAKRRVMYGITEELLVWWQKENPELYSIVMKLNDSLADQFTQDTRALYASIPGDYLDARTPDIHTAWKNHLTEGAVRTYMWFSHSEPPLHELSLEK